MTSLADRLAGVVATHSRKIILVMVLATVVIGAGAPMVEEQSDLGQFEIDSDAQEASQFIEERMVAEGAENQTTVQVIRRGGEGEDVLTREELVATLEFQQRIREHPEIGPTLVEEDPITGVANVIGLYHLGVLLDQLDSESSSTLDPETLSELDDKESAALATALGFETDDEITTVQKLVGILGESEGINVSDGEMDEETVQGYIDLLIETGQLEENETDTAFELFTIATADEAPISLDEFGELNQAERDVVASMSGLESLPTQECVDGLQAMQNLSMTAERPQPPISCQFWVFENMNESQFGDAIQAILGPDGEPDALALVPQSYEPGSTSAQAHSIFITQKTDGGSLESGSFSEEVVTSQLELRALGEDEDRDYLVFGFGILSDEVDQSLQDSIAIVGPIALLFVILVLIIAYRDLVDILLGVAGIIAVILWTFGFMGWTGIAFNQLLIAVPVLLIGLSIDYAIHVFMRHRERREAGDVRRGMKVALAGVGGALVWVTATAAIGFLSNLVSPIGPLKDFGVASAFGIVAALLIFGALIPAVKIEVDEFLEARGYDRTMAAFGTGESGFSSVLSIGATLARKAPIAVVVLTLLISLGGVYGASQVDTSFEEEDFLADDPPEWTKSLPEPFAPEEYTVTQDLGYLQENFQQVGRGGELLIRGNVTNEQVMHWLDAAARNASEQDSVFILPNGNPDVRSPLTDMQMSANMASESPYNTSFHQSSEDGIPTDNISMLYDGFREVNPAASEMVYADDGEYQALRMQIGIAGQASQQGAADDLKVIANHLEAESGGDLDVVATGTPVTNTEVEQRLFETVIESLLITLLAVFAFLAIAYRLAGNTASLGVVTLMPVLFSVTWILGTMWLIGMSFNAITGTIAALTVGLGIAYSIHVSARYKLELEQQEHVWDALQTTATGTGGALLGSAATTTGGFGTLSLAILPALQQFGIITGLTIIYAFLASVLVLPSLLVLWTRYIGPAEHFPGVEDDQEAASSDSQTAPED